MREMVRLNVVKTVFSDDEVEALKKAGFRELEQNAENIDEKDKIETEITENIDEKDKIETEITEKLDEGGTDDDTKNAKSSKANSKGANKRI